MTRTTPRLRPDLALVAARIPDGSHVLDLGCGSGELLAALMAGHHCTGTGVEIDQDAVLDAVRAGVPVMQMDVDERLDEFADDSYDVCVLSRTLQTIVHPAEVLGQMARIADRLIVSVPNFGWWRHRVRLAGGHMPMSHELPYHWYDTPNIRHTTLSDLESLFDDLGLDVVERVPLDRSGRPMRATASNLMAASAVYVLSAPDA